MKKILAIDGGGVRGLIPAILCKKLEQLYGKGLGEGFDLIAGTSTGSIIALALGCGVSADRLVSLYAQNGGSIFSHSRGKRSWFRRPKYSNAELKTILFEVFGNKNLSDATCEILVPSYNIGLRKHKLFTRKEAIDKPEEDFPVKDVALASSAAPTYFPPVGVGSHSYIDGGLAANNPSALALAHARQLWPNEDIALVSMGTGMLAKPILARDAERWGAARWVSPIIDCVFDGSASAVETAVRMSLPRDRYWRFQCPLTEAAENLDDASATAIAALTGLANEMILSHDGSLNEIGELLRHQRPKVLEQEAIASLAEIKDAVYAALDSKNETLCRGINTMLVELQEQVAQWKKGRIYVPADDAADFLLRRYQEARKSVFSTRVKKFGRIFQRSDLPNKILEAHRRSPAIATRLFIYPGTELISGFDYQEMIRQSDQGIDVRVLIGSSSFEEFEDFTLIDDTAVGITRFSPGGPSADWTINDSGVASRFNSLRDSLLSRSISYEEFKMAHGSKMKLWTHQRLVDVDHSNVDDYQKVMFGVFGDSIASKALVLSIQKIIGTGIYLLKRGEGETSKSVGAFAILPLSRQGFRKMESGNLKGADFDLEDVQKFSDAPPLAYYLGAVAGFDMDSKAALHETTITTIRDLSQSGVESVFARPVTPDGVKFVRKLGFEGQGTTRQPQLNTCCRLRLI